MTRDARVMTVALAALLAACGRAREAPPTSSSPAPFSLIDEREQALTEYDESRLRAIFEDGAVTRTVTFGGRSERSLTLPVPSRARYRVAVPAQPVFRLGFALSTLGAETLNAPAEVAVRVEADGAEALVLRHDFPIREPEPNENLWWDGEVDLSPWAGREVEVVLESRWAVDRPVRQPVVVAWGDPVIADRATPTSKPPLILISVDCLRADHLGAYGYARDTTPNIDAVAARGELFESAFSTASWTLPSHMSLLTGELPSMHGATKWEKLDRSVPYLPEVLDRAGYRAAGIVSWVYLSQAYGFERGFDFYEVLPDPEASDIVDRAIAQLDRGAGRSQFLFLHLYDPHWPYLPPPELVERFGPRPSDLSDLLQQLGEAEPRLDALDVEDAKRLYDGEIAFVDRELGRFFEALQARELFDPALIIITADHGEAFGAHGHFQHSQTLYDDIIHVPLIVKWPGNAPRGRRRDLASLVDVFATITEVAQEAEPEPKKSEARSLRSKVEDRTVISEYETRAPAGVSLKVALRTSDTKYIATLAGKPGTDLLDIATLEREELYDLTTDAEEQLDVARERPDVTEAFRAELERFLHRAAQARSSREIEEVDLDPETLELLESLGYVHTRE